MPEFETYVDVSIDEFLDALRPNEIEDLIESLVEGGWINENRFQQEKHNSFIQNDFIKMCEKLSSNYLVMNQDDINTIENIYKKYN